MNVDNLIKGSGQVGNGELGLTNQAAGIVDANQSVALTLNTNAVGASNAGKLEATAGGTLNIQNTTLTQTGAGAILATGTNGMGTASTVVLTNSTVSGGTLTTASGGAITTFGANNLTGVTITSGSTVTTSDNTATYLNGTITNNGTLELSSSNDGTELRVTPGGTTTLTGGGTVQLSDNENHYIRDYNQGTGVLVNLNNTIQGAGHLGVNGLGIDNRGVIDANFGGSTLYLQGNGYNASSPVVTAVLNSNLLEASNGGTLDVLGTVNQTAMGVTQALTGSTVIIDGATINGGTLTTVGTGSMQTAGTSTLSNVTVSAGSTLTASDNTATYLNGTITNNGTILLNSTNDGTELRVTPGGTTTLAGGGTVTLSDNANNLARTNETAFWYA